MTGIVKSSGSGSGSLSPKRGTKIGLIGLAGRIASQKAQSPFLDPIQLPNRIGLMLDISGSMQSEEDGDSKISHLRNALIAFLTHTDFSNTAIAMETFPATQSVALTTQRPYLEMLVMGLESHGCTPMAKAMSTLHTNSALTRGVLVSDGDADSGDACLTVAKLYRESETPIDCVHIGHSAGGEELLKEIASITNGLYIKFENVASFTGAFKYLTPELRGVLTGGDQKEILRLTGAREVL